MFIPLSLLVLNHECFLKSCSNIYQNPFLFASMTFEGSWVIYKTINGKHYWSGKILGGFFDTAVPYTRGVKECPFTSLTQTKRF